MEFFFKNKLKITQFNFLNTKRQNRNFLDSSDLIKVIKRAQRAIKTIVDVVPNIRNASVFSRLNVKSEFF